MGRLVAQVAAQMLPGDEHIVVADAPLPLGGGNQTRLVIGRTGAWGNAGRELGIREARGTHIVLADDDDMLAPNALEVIRGNVALAPERLHIFKMRDGKALYGLDKCVRQGLVGGPMCVAPNDDRQPRWGSRYEADFDYVAALCAAHPEPPIWHPEVTYLVRPKQVP